MIDVSIITKALKAVLDNAGIAGLTIERGERINFDPARCPWCGIYPDAITSEPRISSAAGAPWLNKGQVQIVLQTSSFNDEGRGASDELEGKAGEVIRAVFADPTAGVTGLRLIGVNRQYSYLLFDDDGGGSLFMPQVVLRIGFEMRSAL